MGFKNDFLGKSFHVEPPALTSKQQLDAAQNTKTKSKVLDYIYFSVVQSSSRRVPYFSASNIDRSNWMQIGRTGEFKVEPDLERNSQLTDNDYKQFNSIEEKKIDKGHMTRREDVQWDINKNEDAAMEAALSTFVYTNACPQHHEINNGIWKQLENSILVKGHVPEPHRATVFTGPVLHNDDPVFKKKLNDGSEFKIPVLFWKVIYYVKEDGKLYRAAFLMGQLRKLQNDKLINDYSLPTFNLIKESKSSLVPFLQFQDDETYQVPTSIIEKLTGYKFSEANELYKDGTPVALKVRRILLKEALTLVPTSLMPSMGDTIVEGLVV